MLRIYENIQRDMDIALITPAGAESRYGNRRTAERWAMFLRELGHAVTIQEVWDGASADAMISLHARRSHDSIARYTEAHPERPLIVALTGTDLYRDIQSDSDAQESLDLATRLVVLQEAGFNELEPHHLDKTRVVYQSAVPVERGTPSETSFDVCVIGHLRPEKDPFRAALATHLLPTTSRIHVTHAGGAREEKFASEAASLMQNNPRYEWIGEVSQEVVRDLLSRAHLLVQSSFMEGGANTISEALASSVPIIASDIPGNVGMLGEDYPGYYPAGDEIALARLLELAETDTDFYNLLKIQCEALRPLALPDHEREALRFLIEELVEI